MRNLVVYSIPLLLISGCISQRTIPDENIPYPVTMALFPVLEDSKGVNEVTITALFYILPDGTVDDVAITGPILNPEWDSAAIDSMKRWHFSKLPQGMNQEGAWLRRIVKVHFEEPTVMDLVILAVNDPQIADSLYAGLGSRSNLKRLFGVVENHDFTYKLTVENNQNIAKYPEHVRLELRKLRINNYTKPIRLNDQYLIFQRVETQVPNS